MGNAALTKASGRSCVPGGGKASSSSSSSSMDERIDALVLRLHEVKSSSFTSSFTSSFYIESRKCCHFQTMMMMMMMMSLCRDIGVLVSSSSLGKRSATKKKERKEGKETRASERAFFCESFRSRFRLRQKRVWYFVSLSKSLTLLFLSILLLIIIIVTIKTKTRTTKD